MKLSHLNGLRALESTLRNGTFTAAAEELGVTVAAIGQQIRGLEDYLGLRLFDRLPSGAKPTAEARAIAARLTSGFGQIEDALRELRGAQDRGRITIAMSHFVLEHWLSERLPAFYDQVRDVELTFKTGEGYVDLIAGDADMAVRFSPEPGPEFAWEKVHKGYFMPVCTPGFAERYGLRPGLTDLSGVPLFRLLDATTDPAWIGWDEIIARRSLTRTDPGPTERLTGHRTAVSGQGLMISGLTECFSELREGRLVAPLGPDFVFAFSYGYRLVWPANRSLSRPMRVFRTWLMAERDRYLAEASEILGRTLD